MVLIGVEDEEHPDKSKGSEPRNNDDDEIKDEEAEDDSDCNDVTPAVEPIGKDEDDKSSLGRTS